MSRILSRIETKTYNEKDKIYYNVSAGCRDIALHNVNYIYSISMRIDNEYKEIDHFSYNLFVNNVSIDNYKITFYFKEYTPINISKFFITLFRVYLYRNGNFYDFVHDIFYYKSTTRYSSIILNNLYSSGRGSDLFALYFLESLLFYDKEYFNEFIKNSLSTLTKFYIVMKFPIISDLDNKLRLFIKNVRKHSAYRNINDIKNSINRYITSNERW